MSADGLRHRVLLTATASLQPKNEAAPAAPSAPPANSPLPSTTAYFLARICFARLLGLVCFVANLGALLQNLPLLGSRGLYPACRASSSAPQPARGALSAFLERPSLFHFLGCNDDALVLCAAAGTAISLVPLVFGSLPLLPVLLPLWLIQASFVNLNSPWYAFGWETQLLETLFWAAASAPLLSTRRFEASLAPSTASSLLFRILIGKIMLGAGLIKIRGDACWLSLTGDGTSCMDVRLSASGARSGAPAAQTVDPRPPPPPSRATHPPNPARPFSTTTKRSQTRAPLAPPSMRRRRCGTPRKPWPTTPWSWARPFCCCPSCPAHAAWRLGLPLLRFRWCSFAAATCPF